MDLSFLPITAISRYGRTKKVSILVLMDLSFLLIPSDTVVGVGMHRFNPCSYGSFVLT